MSIERYIKDVHGDLESYIKPRYKEFYAIFSNLYLIEVFSALHEMIIDGCQSMNSYLPTRDYIRHFSADGSRLLLNAIECIKNLEINLKDSKYAFCIEGYYSAVIDKLQEFLAPKEGSDIPSGMDKIRLYFEKPIFLPLNSIKISSGLSNYNASLTLIGYGSYANVYEYYDSFYNRKFALKRAKDDLNEKELKRFRREYEQMSNLHSPYIVEVYRFDEEKNEYIMEYVDYTLSKYIFEFNPSITERKKLVRQVFKAFKYIHSKGLLHRDIGWTNILIKKYDDISIVKVSDFGLVKIPDSTLTDLSTKFKGRFNDFSLNDEGFNNYSMIHETYALTSLSSHSNKATKYRQIQPNMV